MSLKPTTVITETTDAVAVVHSFPVTQKMIPATVFASNLAGSEVVPILFSVDGGETFEALGQEGAALELSPGPNALTINSPPPTGVHKPAPAPA